MVFLSIPQTLLLLIRAISVRCNSILLFLCIPQTLLLILSVISAHASSILLISCSSQILLLLLRVISAHPSSILLFVCISETLLLLFSVISAHPSSILLFFAFHRPSSYSLVSLVRILALSVLLLNCIDLSLTHNSHCYSSDLHFALFMHSTDLDLTRECHRCGS